MQIDENPDAPTTNTVNPHTNMENGKAEGDQGWTIVGKDKGKYRINFPVSQQADTTGIQISNKFETQLGKNENQEEKENNIATAMDTEKCIDKQTPQTPKMPTRNNAENQESQNQEMLIEVIRENQQMEVTSSGKELTLSDKTLPSRRSTITKKNSLFEKSKPSYEGSVSRKKVYLTNETSSKGGYTSLDLDSLQEMICTSEPDEHFDKNLMVQNHGMGNGNPKENKSEDFSPGTVNILPEKPPDPGVGEVYNETNDIEFVDAQSQEEGGGKDVYAHFEYEFEEDLEETQTSIEANLSDSEIQKMEEDQQKVDIPTAELNFSHTKTVITDQTERSHAINPNHNKSSSKGLNPSISK
ncbi:hypothetical protein K7X08_006305 [Anisodus acutangulus]|uniref:Uncharacterized protein n=1 Tax=Anisodus acutangulus TaxID=402998 RepID=A0A9Q1RRV1_9SOLA|nr:hypothetical protein K7X08_006305 [Anisodus acutangulus]